MNPGAPGPALFVQPHYDDVPLSCGGVVASMAEAGCEPRMITVFAGELVDEMVGDFAAWKHRRWGLEDAEATQVARRAEDEAAAAALGCPVRWLGLPDAIYRGDRYQSDPELFGELREDERELAAHLAEELMQLPEWRPGNRVFVPLGAGSHVDHQLVFEAGRHLATRGVEVWAYEDCPYAIHTPAGVPKRLAELGGAVGAPVVVPIGGHLARRLASIEQYGTQLPVIFRFTDDWAGAVAAHAEGVGDGAGPAERFWPVLPAGEG